MKAKELREKKIEELEKILKEKREKLKNLKLDLIQGKLKNVREIRETKRDIARILTILNSKIKDQNAKWKCKMQREFNNFEFWFFILIFEFCILNLISCQKENLLEK